MSKHSRILRRLFNRRLWKLYILESSTSQPLYYDDYDDDEFGNVTALFETYDNELLNFGAIACIIASVIGVLGNLITIAALVRCPNLHNATTAFILNLCVCDCFYCAFVPPLIGSTMMHETWIHGHTLCVFQAFIQFLTRTVSAFTMGVIALNRYILIIHGDYYHKVFTKRNIALIIGSLWLLAVVFFLPTLASSWGTYGFSSALGICTILNISTKDAPVSLFGVIAFLIVVIACCILFCYCRIYCVARNISRTLNEHQDRTIAASVGSIQSASTSQVQVQRFHEQQGTPICKTQDSQMEMRIFKVVSAIFCVFLLSFFPIVIVRLAELEDQIPALHICAYLGLSLGACVNPLIYVAMSREYRYAYKKMILCHKNRKTGNRVAYTSTPASARFYIES